MKKISFLAAVATSMLSLTTVFSQTGNVGINTETPQATLHVKGQPSNSSSLDGVIAPTLTGDQMASKTYTLAQTGAIVYSTAPAASLTGQVINVTAPGYYYFDGVVWQKVTNSNEAWLTRGNLGTNATTNYLGTNDNVDLVFRRNKLHGGFIGSTNTGLGTSSMPQNAPGTYNVAFGNAALSALTTGTNNVGLGAYSGNVLTSGAGNVLVGTSAGLSITSGGWNVFVGDNTGRTLTTGNVNVGLGNRSLRNSTTAFKNIAMGQSALENLTTGSYNVALGQAAGYRLTTENKNVMIGAQTGSYVTGENNVFIGTGAGRSNTVNTIETVNNRLVIHSNVNFVPNPAPGSENVSDLTASWTNGLVIGDFKDRWLKINGNFQLNPGYNPADATYTKILVSKPDGTVGIGDPVAAPAGWLIGGNNIGIGMEAGKNISRGNNNIIIGKNAGSLLDTGERNIIIGNNIEAPGDGDFSNTLNIGNFVMATDMNQDPNVSTLKYAGFLGIGTPTPKSTLQVAGTVAFQTVTLLPNDIFDMDTASGNYYGHTFILTSNTVILPNAASYPGRQYTFVLGGQAKISSFIKGTISNLTYSGDYELNGDDGKRGITITSNGTNWFATNVF